MPSSVIRTVFQPVVEASGSRHYNGVLQDLESPLSISDIGLVDDLTINYKGLDESPSSRISKHAY